MQYLEQSLQKQYKYIHFKKHTIDKLKGNFKENVEVVHRKKKTKKHKTQNKQILKKSNVAKLSLNTYKQLH